MASTWLLIPEQIQLPEGEGDGFILAVVTDGESVKVVKRFPLVSIDVLKAAGRNVVTNLRAKLAAKEIVVGEPIDITPPEPPIEADQKAQEKFLTDLGNLRRVRRAQADGLTLKLDEAALTSAVQEALATTPSFEALL